MKILHINTIDLYGGAARAAYRIHRGLLAIGIGSEMVVSRKNGDDWTVVVPHNGSRIERLKAVIRSRIEALLFLCYSEKQNTPWSANLIPNKELVKFINDSDCDVVHLHWVNQAFLSISDITNIRKPIVWTMHDMWGFTGGCHVAGECEGYNKFCDDCPHLKMKGITFLSRYVFGKKHKVLNSSNITFIAPSRWLAKCAYDSTLLCNKKVCVIPNGVDTKVYKPVDKYFARDVYNIDQSETVILFGAVNATSDYNKGYDLLKNAVLRLPQRLQGKEVTLVVFGAGSPKVPEDFPYKIVYTGRLHDDASLVSLYNCADVMVVPSRQESFGQTALEAMACGVPVVAFAATGLLDIIEHKRCGYLARPYDIDDLSDGIAYCVQKKGEFRKNCVNHVKKKFDIQLVARQYLDAYKSVI